MPYEMHPDLITPPDSKILWRYVDFPRLLDMLERRVLWFPRLDTLEDPLEGSWTDLEIKGLRSLPPDPTPLGRRSIGDSYLSLARTSSQATFVNCWRAGSHESMAMWDIYRRGAPVIAVKSTVGFLKQTFAVYNKPVNIGEVKYTDWNEAAWDNNLLVMCVRKELAYLHEAEVRAVILDSDKVGVPSPPLGLEVKFDPCTLITEVIVGPREKPWIYAIVERVARRYGLTQQVSASNLLRPRI